MATAAVDSVVIYDRETKVSVGSLVYVDGRNIGERLLPGDDPCEGWEGCQFRYPSNIFPRGIACNVTITGRTLQRKHDALCVRVCIKWVHDGEPNTTCGGWLVVE